MGEQHLNPFAIPGGLLEGGRPKPTWVVPIIVGARRVAKAER